jgi:purine-binding chemotaxis protein CheW
VANPPIEVDSSLSAVAEKSEKTFAQFVGFEIDGQEYAFRIEQIQEIVILPKVTAVPQAPDFCEGVSNLRGAIIPIINLRKLFGLKPIPPNAETRTIVVNVGEQTMGCTVDMVSQVIRIPQDSIQPAPEALVTDGMDYVIGFGKLEDRLLVLVDIDRLLGSGRIEHVRQISLGVEGEPL